MLLQTVPMGKIADRDVTAQKWAMLQTLVTDALEIVMQGGASWRRPQMVHIASYIHCTLFSYLSFFGIEQCSCPSGMATLMMLRPAVDVESPAQASDFPRFTPLVCRPVWRVKTVLVGASGRNVERRATCVQRSDAGGGARRENSVI
jgi:hypothetical protein